MNHISHVLFVVLKTCQNRNLGDTQLRDKSLTTRHPSHQSKKIFNRFQHSDHGVLQFLGFASNIFLLKQGWSHQSYQLILQKRRYGNLNDIHVQNLCTDVLAYTVLFYQNFYFQTCSCSIYYESGLQFDQCIASHQINQIFVITVKTMVCLKGFPCDSASKGISFCNIFTHFATFTTTFVTTNCSVGKT